MSVKDNFLDTRLDALLKRPPLWGSRESVELQALQLMEARAAMMRPDLGAGITRHFRSSCEDFREKRWDRPCSILVSQIIPEDDERFSALSRELTELRRYLEQQYEPLSPFKRHGLVLVLEFVLEVESPPVAALSNLLDTFRKVVSGVAAKRLGGGRRNAEVEKFTDFRATEFEVLPRNGKPARATVALSSPTSSQLSFLQQAPRVHEALDEITAVAGWADQHGPDAGIEQLFPEEDLRRLLAVQTSRLVPDMGSTVHSLTIGGNLLPSDRVVHITQKSWAPLKDVITRNQTPRDFDREGEVRQIDMDHGRLRLRMVSGESRECRLPEGLKFENPKQLIGSLVRVQGDEYDAGGKPFVIAKRLTEITPNKNEDDE